jgi:hypothetical protein
VNDARAWASASFRPTHRVLGFAGLMPFLPPAVYDSIVRSRGRQRRRTLPAWIDAEGLRAGGLDRALEAPAQASPWSRESQVNEFWSFHVSQAVPVLGWRERWATLPYQVEIRSPFFDLRVMELLLRFPSWVHWAGTQNKQILRKAMLPRLPERVVRRPDKGYYTELLNRGIFEEEPGRVGRALEAGALTALPYVRRQTLVEQFDAFRRDPHPRFYDLLKVISAGLWHAGASCGNHAELEEAMAV